MVDGHENASQTGVLRILEAYGGGRRVNQGSLGLANIKCDS